MTTMSRDLLIKELVTELSGSVQKAEKTLTKIEEDKSANKNLFSFFSETMFTIRGATQQLSLPKISEIAGLAEELALKAAEAERVAHIRKWMGGLWDALTTVKDLLEHHDEETTEEQDILVNRLEKTLAALGGARPTFSVDEISALIDKNKK